MLEFIFVQINSIKRDDFWGGFETEFFWDCFEIKLAFLLCSVANWYRKNLRICG